MRNIEKMKKNYQRKAEHNVYSGERSRKLNKPQRAR